MGLTGIDYMKVVGITGRLGAGKSFVAQELSFNTPNSKVIEIDFIRNALFKTSKAKDAIRLRKEIAHAFEVCTDSQYAWLDYAAFYQKLFSSPKQVSLCANIMTPYIKKRIKRILSEFKKENVSKVYLAWAYLIEQDYLDMVDEVILVTCQENLALTRAEFSPHFNPEEAKRRRAIEPSDTERISILEEKEISFKVINNSKSIAEHLKEGTFLNARNTKSN